MKKPEAFESSPFKYEADDSPGFLLWRVIALWQRKLAGIFGEFGITQTQFAILASLRWFELQQEPPTQVRLVEHAKIDKMTLSKAIRKLEANGYVLREPSVSDTRAIRIRFTDGGRQLIHQAILAVERADDEFFSCLTEQQLISFKTLGISLIAGNSP
ncbi:MAG: MarR family transcriptional regulator [Betaproteobacteria bacterium]|uniref:MarR family winged helix-turn-helix transcriptional regulator n=1 Tax=Ferrovum sp. TaxID=2609467 RepID=UPI0023217905|nr:MarR family transcriptional regulator [Ferrovum sp.]MDA8415978.1 MarR family transcriptional regulator [Betaproteobacteria bacterium]